MDSSTISQHNTHVLIEARKVCLSNLTYKVKQPLTVYNLTATPQTPTLSIAKPGSAKCRTGARHYPRNHNPAFPNSIYSMSGRP